MTEIPFDEHYVRAELAAGRDSDLRAQLVETQERIRSDNGFDTATPAQQAEGIAGTWNLGLLRDNTNRAIKLGRQTPMEKLRDCEIASVYLRYADMTHPNAQKALVAAREGKTINGVPLESAKLQQIINQPGKKNDLSEPVRKSGGFVLGEWAFSSPVP